MAGVCDLVQARDREPLRPGFGHPLERASQGLPERLDEGLEFAARVVEVCRGTHRVVEQLTVDERQVIETDAVACRCRS